MANRTKPVEPLPGLAPWAGGKRNLATRLVERIEAIPHKCYAEPFIGMGGVFFRRRFRPQAETINDRSGEVVNLFRIVRRHPEAFIEELRLQIFGRGEFERFLRTDPSTLTDVQRAARFYYIQRACFSGLPGNKSFPPTPLRSKAIAPAVLKHRIAAAHERLARVTIENLPYEEFIVRYDRPATLFYLDPPYWNLEDLYGKGMFERADFSRLADLLKGLKGSFIMSINDVPEIREMFTWATIETVTVTYKFKGTKRVRELLISAARE